MTVALPHLLRFASLGVLLAGCQTGTPRPAPGRPPAPVSEYWGMPSDQVAFARLAPRLAKLEVEHAETIATSSPGDSRITQLTTSLLEGRAELAALPNPAIAEIVFAERLDLALDRRLRELAVTQRLLLARVRPEDQEAKEMAATIAAVTARRVGLHLHQDTLHARYRADPTLAPGEWIRITIPAGEGVSRQRATGRLLDMRQDSVVWMTSGGSPRTVALPDHAILERLVSRRGHAWEGALIGLVAGNVVGRIKRSPYDDQGGLRALVLSPLGALIGGLMGSTFFTEQWAPVTRPLQRVTVAPTGTGLGLRWSLPPLRGPH